MASTRLDAFLWGSIAALLALLFYLFAPAVPDDWTNFHDTTWRLLSRQSDFNVGFVYPPHVIILLLPLTALPLRLGYALICAISLCTLAYFARRERIGLAKTLGLVLSPPVFYTLLHGQIDVLLMGAVLLPRPLWTIAAISKPQMAGGLLLRTGWLGLTLGAAVLLADYLVVPTWQSEAMLVSKEAVAAGYNVLGGYWPQQLAVAAGLLVVGFQRKDKYLLLAASPFLMPYAALSSFTGVWWLLCTRMGTFALYSVFAVWWGAIAWRLIA